MSTALEQAPVENAEKPNEVVGESAAPVEKRSLAHRHVPALDGVRALAVILVLLVHTGGPYLHPGRNGVDLFFVLSGFLITSILIGEFDRTGRISLVKFWGRRILRLMPLYLLYVGAMTALVLSDPNLKSSHGWSPEWFIASMWLYFMNYLPLGGFSEWNHLTFHFWSLCVEEQFYLIWPIILSVSLRHGKEEVVAWSLAAIVFVTRLFETDVWHLVLRLNTRGFAIILGCACAITLMRSWRERRAWLSHPWLLPAVFFGIAAMSVAHAVIYERDHDNNYYLVKYQLPFFAMLFTLLVAAAWYGQGWMQRMLSWRPLTYIGQISYGIYVYHMIGHWIMWGLHDGDRRFFADWGQYPGFIARSLCYMAISVGIAAISYHFYEKRFLALKERLR